MPKKYYFTHSYCFDKNDLEINDSTDYVSWIAGTNIVAAYRTKNIFGIQFHPEKSHDQGNEFVNKMLIEWV
jgi:glutamine amidotransferase